MRTRRILLPIAAGVLVMAAPAAARHSDDHRTAAAATAPKVTVLADGLRNPRHLDLGSGDDLYVAESGRGGGTASCFDSAEGASCVGATGAVTRIEDAGDRTPGRVRRIADGLASFAPASGDNAIGPHGIDVSGRTVYLTNGGPTEPKRNGQTVLRDTLVTEEPVADLFGRLLKLERRGRTERLADIWDFERDTNPDAQVANPAIDSNPVAVERRRGRFLVADAGGNTVLQATGKGAVSVFHLFANTTAQFQGNTVPMQTVPTGVAVGPDGNVYVSQLTGFPFPVGGAKVFVLDRRTGAVIREITGFTNAIDLAFGKDGELYVLELDADSLLAPGTDGAIVKVARGAATGTRIALPAGTLTEPGGIAVGDRGTLYVTNRARSGSQGQVLRIQLGRDKAKAKDDKGASKGRGKDDSARDDSRNR
jgi:DNA-binding beta-propeller fold protein YncE